MKKFYTFLFLIGLAVWGLYFFTNQYQPRKISYTLYFPQNSPHFCLLYYLSEKGYWDLYSTKVKLISSRENATLIALKASDKLPRGYKVFLKLSNFEPYSVYARKANINFSFQNKTVILPPKGSKPYQDVVEFLARQGLKPYKDYTPYFDIPLNLQFAAFSSGIGNFLITPTANLNPDLTMASLIKAPDIGLLAVKDDIKPTDLKTIFTAVYWGQKAFIKSPEPTSQLFLSQEKQLKLLNLLQKEGFYPENLIFNPENIALAQKYYNNPPGPFFPKDFYDYLLADLKKPTNYQGYFIYLMQKIITFK